MVEADKKSSRSSSSSSKKSDKSDKSKKSEEAPAEAAPATEPFVIAKYVLNGGEQSWVPESPHSSFQDIFKDYENEGSNDWAYNHNRLLAPGESKIKFRYELPVDAIKEAHPDCKFTLRTAYFAPWQMSACTVTVSLNGDELLKSAQVVSEDQGRTKHDSEFDADEHKEGEIEIFFDGGAGVLFLWYVEILVTPD